MQRLVLAGCLVLFPSSSTALGRSITATIASAGGEVTIEARHLHLGWAINALDTNVSRPAHPSMVATFHSRDARALRGPRMDHWSPTMPMVINWVLAVYLAGSIWSIMSFCQMLWRYVWKSWDWRPFIIPLTAAFAFIPLGLAGFLVFRRADGTCSYGNTQHNFIIPISDLGSCGGRSYNTPELLSEFVIVAAVNSCIYAQMLSRFFGRQFQGEYWPTLACRGICLLGWASMLGLVGVAVIPTYLSRLPHRIAAYAFFLASIWMLFLYSVLVIFLPPTLRRKFLYPAVLAVVLWSSMTIYGVLFSINICERLCGGATFDQEPHTLEMQRGVMAEYNKYRWCLSIESVAEWLLVALYAFWILLAPVESTQSDDVGKE